MGHNPVYNGTRRLYKKQKNKTKQNNPYLESIRSLLVFPRSFF